MTNEERIRRAKALLEDDLLQEVFDGIRLDAHTRFAGSAFSEDEKRREAWLEIRATERVQAALHRIANPKH